MRPPNNHLYRLFLVPLVLASLCLFILAPRQTVVGQSGTYCPTPMGRTCSGYSVCTKSGDCTQQLFGSCCSVLTPAATYPTNTPVATPTPATWPYTLRTFYQFNDNTSSATITKSSVSPTHDGTNSGVTYTTSGTSYAGAGVFNGTSSFFSIPHSSVVSPGSQFSLSAWIKPTALSSEMAIVSKLGTVGAYSYELVTTSTGKLRLYISGDGNTIDTLTSSTSLTAGAWQKAIVTFDNGSVIFYINSIGEAPQTTTITAPYIATGAPVYIGQKVVAGSFFNGQMDEVCFYGQSLTSTEVTSLASTSCSGTAPTSAPTTIPTPTTPFTLALSHTTPSTVVAGQPVQWTVTISNPTNASQAAWAFNLLVTVPSSVTGVVWKCEVTNVGTPRGEMMAYPTTCAGSGTAAYVDANTYQITLGHTGSADPLIHPGGNIKVTVGGFIKKSAGSTSLTMSAIISNYSGWPTNALYSVNRLTNSAPQGPTPTLSTLAVPTVVPISINPIIGAALTATPTPTLYPVQPTSTSAPTPTPTLTPTPPPVVRSTCQDTNKVLRTLVNNQSQYYCATATNDLVVVKGTTVEKLNGINTQILNLDFQNGGVVNGVQLVRVVMKVQSVIKVQGATQPLARDYSLVLRMR